MAEVAATIVGAARQIEGVPGETLGGRPLWLDDERRWNVRGLSGAGPWTREVAAAAAATVASEPLFTLLPAVRAADGGFVPALPAAAALATP